MCLADISIIFAPKIEKKGRKTMRLSELNTGEKGVIVKVLGHGGFRKRIVEMGFHPIIIATKLDKIKRSQIQKQIKIVKQGLDLIPGTMVIPFSAETKQGRDEIWELVENEFLTESEMEE